MNTEIERLNMRIWGGPIVAVIQPQDEANRGAATKVTISYDDKKDQYLLECDDLVANTWVEIFPSLSTALLRFALLARCGESDWNLCFLNNPDSETFLTQSEEFLWGQVG